MAARFHEALADAAPGRVSRPGLAAGATDPSAEPSRKLRRSMMSWWNTVIPKVLPRAVGSAPSTGASPREERLDALGTVELIEPGEARVVVGEPTGKHPQRLIRICAVEGSKVEAMTSA